MDVSTENAVTRVLVVSDNSELLNVTLETLEEISRFSNLIFESRYSSSNTNVEQLSKLGATAINFRDTNDVEWASGNFDLIFSIHCKQIFPKDLVDRVKCVNFHPGYNPHNRGWFPQVFSIINDKPVGVTVHLMDPEVDHGEIITQTAVVIEEWETSLDVYKKVIAKEIELIKTFIPTIVQGNLQTTPPIDEGNYNSITDFKSLCELNLENVGTLGEHIKLLRALSHGDFHNAYFHSKNGEKISISVTLTKLTDDN